MGCYRCSVAWPELTLHAAASHHGLFWGKVKRLGPCSLCSLAMCGERPWLPSRLSKYHSCLCRQDGDEFVPTPLLPKGFWGCVRVVVQEININSHTQQAQGQVCPGQVSAGSQGREGKSSVSHTQPLPQVSGGLASKVPLTHACNPITQETEARGSQVQDHPGPHSETLSINNKNHGFS
jgi:hypothetical protein